MESNTTKYSDRPTRYSYCIEDNFWAGEYPIDKDPQRAVEKLDAMLRFGITDFIDLTEEGELRSYELLLPSGVNYVRFPIRDCSVPSTLEQMDEILEKINSVLSSPSRKVYIHCWGGVGRTGTVCACYFVRKGKSAQDALVALKSCFAMNEKSQWREIPETQSQLEYIRQYDKRLHNRKSNENRNEPKNI